MNNRLFIRQTGNYITTGLVSLLTVGLLFAACETKIERIEITMDLSIGSSMNFDDPQGGEQTFSVSTNTIKWDVISSDPSWLTVTKRPTSIDGETAVTVTASPNRDTTRKEATVTVTGTGIETRTVNVTIAAVPVPPKFNVTPEELLFSGAGEQKDFRITSVTDWTVSVDTVYNQNESPHLWLGFSQEKGANNATVSATASANPLILPRKHTITVSEKSGEKKYIQATQQGRDETPRLDVNTKTMNFSAAGDTKNFRITSNTRWEVSCSADWIVLSEDFGSLNMECKVTASRNTTTMQRNARITVSGQGDVATQYIEVTQDSTLFLNVSPTSLIFSPFAKYSELITIKSNTGYEMTKSSSASWFEILYSAGYVTNEGAYIDGGWVVKPNSINTNTTPRTGTITVRGTGITQSITVNVTQQAGSYVRPFDLTSTMKAVLIDTVLVITTSKSAEDMPNSVGNTDYQQRVNASILSAVVEPGVTSIGNNAFFMCNNIRTVTLHNAITRIGESAFSRCMSLPSITIPKAVNFIGYNAFYYCSALRTVTVEWNTPLVPATDIFDRAPVATAVLRVPKGTKSSYQNAYVWQNFGTIEEY